MATPNQQHDFQHLLSPMALAMATTRHDPEPYVYARHLHFLSDELVKLYRRPPGHPRNLMCFEPPRHGKSEKCSHWFPTWALALDPRNKIILTSYEAEVAARWGRACRRTVTENYAYIGAKLLEDSKAANRWETSERGGMVTAGVGGPITGKGGNILICDDPIKNAEEANSEVMRDNLWEWWQTTFLTRRQKGPRGEDPIVVFIMTRWHEDDLAARILENEKDSNDWMVIDLPALAEDDDQLGRPLGAALWPERYDEADLEETRRKIGSRNFTALYQQKPSPPEGQMIHRLWWKWYDKRPDLSAFDQIVQSWDPTFDDAETNDYVVGQVWGRLGGDFYLLDTVRERMNFPETLKAIHKLSEKWPQARYKLIEKSANGFAIIQTLKHELGGVLPTGTKSRSKETRLTYGTNNVAAVIERGQVFLPREGAWATRLVDEAAQFPHGTHDDMIDAMVMAIEYLMPGGWAYSADEKRRRAEAPPENNVDLMRQQLHAAIRKKIEAGQRGSNDQRQSSMWAGGF